MHFTPANFTPPIGQLSALLGGRLLCDILAKRLS
jgi:hypothetical protein